MTKYYLLAIPIAIGIIAGGFLALYSEPEIQPTKLTPSTLIENGSPVLGEDNAPITILEWGGLPMHIMLQISQKYTRCN